MNEVLNNLGKKDSLKLLMENFESTLHNADHVNESPRLNDAKHLVHPKDLEEDCFSQKLLEK